MNLEEYIAQARATTDPEQRQRIYAKLIHNNMGLAASLGKAFNKLLSSPNYTFDVMSVGGWMWEAIPLLVTEWDSSKGKASTCWRKITLRLARKEAYDQCYVASVRVPAHDPSRYTAEALPGYDDEPVEEEFLQMMDALIAD